MRFKNNITKSIQENGFENAIKSKTKSPIPDFIKDYSNFNEEFSDMIPANYNKRECNFKLWQIFSHFLSYEGSGIIIAGFDRNNHYPSIHVFNLYCNDCGKIIYQNIETIENSKEPLIRIYAINEEAYAFITGINDEFEDYIKQYIDNSNEHVLNDFQYWLFAQNVENAHEIYEILKHILTIEYSDYTDFINFNKFTTLNHTSELCEYLPRKLLCDFADYLIKLTALKQKISLDLETVSSESEILLITKSNKPKWVKSSDEIL